MAPAKKKPGLRQCERTELTCAKILRAAKEIFARDGFQAAKLEQIVARAGYTRGAFYANFSSKEELFLVVARQEIGSLVESTLETIRAKKNAEEKCRAMLRALRENPETKRWALVWMEFNLYVLRHARSRKKIAAQYQQAMTATSGIFAELYRSECCEPPLPLVTISLGFGCLLQGLALHETLNGQLVTPEISSAILLRYIHAMMETGPAGRVDGDESRAVQCQVQEE
ncbi:MAG: TetR/AcrR family transcriptional regulator [Terracidiphilus sp.]